MKRTQKHTVSSSPCHILRPMVIWIILFECCLQVNMSELQALWNKFHAMSFRQLLMVAYYVLISFFIGGRMLDTNKFKIASVTILCPIYVLTGIVISCYGKTINYFKQMFISVFAVFDPNRKYNSTRLHSLIMYI